MTLLDTGWRIIKTASPGLAKPGPMDPAQTIRVRRLDGRALIDLAGLRLDTSKPGLAELATLPAWAEAIIPDQILWVNDDPSSLHASQIAVHRGRTIFWLGQVADGKVAVNRPALLHGGIDIASEADVPPGFIKK
ncbi:MAG: hypothetical protein ACTIA5_01335 [Brachybacterium tyrofermentans]